MSHFLTEIFEILFEIIEFSEPYLLVTTIFVIPFSIMITSVPKRFFQYEFTQHLLPSLFAKYENKKQTLEKINAMTQNAMIVILMIDLFGLGHFFFGGHGGSEAGVHHEAGANDHPSQHGAEAVGEEISIEH